MSRRPLRAHGQPHQKLSSARPDEPAGGQEGKSPEPKPPPRLRIIRAIGDIPRYLNTERGFATNILFGPAVVAPTQRAELNDKYRSQTNGARDTMNELRKTLVGDLDDGAELGAGIDALNAKLNALRDAIDKAIDGPAEPRKNAAKKKR